MRALVIAIGNALRGDDGVAHHVQVPASAERRIVHQLTPELAAEIAEYETVVFVDADVRAADARIEPVGQAAAPTFSHVAQPAEVVALARALFGFQGSAYLCRIPARDFSPGEGLSLRTQELAEHAAPLIAALL
jgi:hydrogenase maturation protease